MDKAIKFYRFYSYFCIMVRAEVKKVFTFSGHGDCVYSLQSSPEEQQFFSASGDGMVVRWSFNRPDEGELLAKVPNSVYAMALSKGQNRLLVGQNFSGLHVIDLDSKSELRNIVLTDSAIFDICICHTHVWVIDGTGVVFILDIKDFHLVSTTKLSDKSARSISFCPFENEVAIGFSDNSVKILDIVTFQVKREIAAHTNSVFSVIYSPDGRWLLTAGRDAHIKVWDVHNNYSLVHDIVAHMFAINHLVYSPDGDYFASASMDKSIKVWDAKTFQLIKVIDKARHAGHGTSVNKLLWMPFENFLVSGSDDRNISVWDVQFTEK